MPRRSIAPAICFLAAAAAALPALRVEACDGRPRLVAPFLPGGVSGAVGELLARDLPSRLGTPVTLDFLPGDGGARAMQELAASDDPCALLIGTVSSQILLPVFRRERGEAPLPSFVPVALVGAAPLIVAVRPTLAVRNVGELVAHGRQNVLRFGSTGVGTVPHVAAVMFARLTNVRFEHVPVEAGSRTLAAELAAGRIDVAFDNGLAPFVHEGKVRAIAVTSRTRLAAMPSLPTVAEAGVPGYDATPWVGLFATGAATPAFVENVARALGQTAHDPGTRAYFQHHGIQPRFLGPVAFATFVQAETARWGREAESAAAQGRGGTAPPAQHPPAGPKTN